MNRQEQLLTGGGRGSGRRTAEGSSATGDGGQAAVSLTPDIDGSGAGSLLKLIQSTLLKKWSGDIWVVLYQINHLWCSTYFWTSWARSEESVLRYSMQHCTVTCTKAQPLVENACVWQCMPDTWTNFCDGTCKRTFASLKIQTWTFLCRGFTVLY